MFLRLYWGKLENELDDFEVEHKITIFGFLDVFHVGSPDMKTATDGDPSPLHSVEFGVISEWPLKQPVHR